MLGNGMVGEAGEPFANPSNDLPESAGLQSALKRVGNFQPTPHRSGYENRLRLIVRTTALFERVPGGRPPRFGALDDVTDRWLMANWFSGHVRVRASSIPGDWRAHCAMAPKLSSRSESAPHVAAKLLAAEWLASIGLADVQEEAICFIGRADVFSAAGRVVVEVGHTPRDKLLRCAEAGYRFILVPYRRKDARPKAVEFLISETAGASARAMIRDYQRGIAEDVAYV